MAHQQFQAILDRSHPFKPAQCATWCCSTTSFFRCRNAHIAMFGHAFVLTLHLTSINALRPSSWPPACLGCYTFVASIMCVCVYVCVCVWQLSDLLGVWTCHMDTQLQ